tara:strand:+ start:207 stop:1070 length:864 start_codon:yes stop_codon:yes gene_type:complete
MNNTTPSSGTVEETVEETIDEVTDETVETDEPGEDSVDADADTESIEEQLMTIDELLGINEEDYEEFQEDANHKGMKPLHEWMKHIPEDVRKHVANIRSSYTQKTQELAEMRRQLDTERAELMRQQDMAVNNPFLKEAEKALENQEENDLYTAEGMQAEIKRQAAQMLKEMMQPAREEIQMKQRRLQLENFKTENPELMQDEYRMPVAEMLRERPELTLEDAFYIVKAKVETQKAKEEREQMSRQRSSRRETLRKTSNGKSVTPSGTPKFRDAWEAYQYHKSQTAKK